MKQTEMKSNVLQQLIEAMLGETSGRMKPKVVTIDIIKPIKGKEGLEEVLKEASEEAPDMGEPADVDEDGDHDEDDHEMAEEDCDDDEKNPRMSLKEFLSRK